jgi:hypothetical protein
LLLSKLSLSKEAIDLYFQLIFFFFFFLTGWEKF